MSATPPRSPLPPPWAGCSRFSSVSDHAPLRSRRRDRDVRRARDHEHVLRNWEKIGPGAKTLSLIPERTRLLQATIGLLAVMAIAFAYQKSRQDRMLRAARDDPPAARTSGVNIHRQRLLAFPLSGGLAGFAGGLLVHLLGFISTTQVFLDLTFITLAMLVIGGAGSLWGSCWEHCSSPASTPSWPRRRRASATSPSRRHPAAHARRADVPRPDPAAARAYTAITSSRRTLPATHPSLQGLAHRLARRDPSERSAHCCRGAPRREGHHHWLQVRSAPLFTANLAAARPDAWRFCHFDVSQPHVDAINEHGLRLSRAGDVLLHPTTGDHRPQGAAAVRFWDRGDEGNPHGRRRGGGVEPRSGTPPSHPRAERDRPRIRRRSKSACHG